MDRKTTGYALLGLLTLAPEGASGYDLRQYAENSIGHFWSESYGQIYPVLKQLSHQGLVASKKDTGSGKRERVLYSITPAGRKRLRAWLDTPARLQPPRIEILLKLFFGPEAPDGAHVARVCVFRDLHAGLLKHYDDVEQKIRSQYQTHPNLPYWMMTLDFGRRRSQMSVEWCDATLRKLKDLPGRRVGKS